MLGKIRTFFNLIRFEHTVFALPFAYLGMLLARKSWPGWSAFIWITLAMASARTAGMCLNRIIDLKIDAKNPRTQERPLVTGEFRVLWVWGVVLVSLLLFFLSAGILNPLCFKLSPIALFLLLVYHYVKRFSFLCHWTLGLTLSLAPIGGWLAVTGAWAWPAMYLGLAVMMWVAGFDILYSLQDLDFDRACGLHSVPVQFGTKGALRIAEICHVLTFFFFVIFGIVEALGILYWVGLLLVALLLKLEHALVSEDDLSRINAAFFAVNGWIGILMLIFTFLEIY